MTEIELLNHKLALIAYLKAKIEVQDWHAVSDVANDLREIEVEIKHAQKGHMILSAVRAGMEKGINNLTSGAINGPDGPHDKW